MTEGPIPSQVGNTALSMGRALASNPLVLLHAMFCLLRVLADVSCLFGKWQSSKGSTAVSSSVCRFEDSFILPKGSQCPLECTPKGSQCPSAFMNSPCCCHDGLAEQRELFPLSAGPDETNTSRHQHCIWGPSTPLLHHVFNHRQ